MIVSGIYTKDELAEILNVSAKKTSNITRKLNSLGFEYETSGRGADYRIHIIHQPQTLKSFFKNNFGIKVNNEEHLAHLLNFILSSGTKVFAYRALSHYTYYTANTIGKLIENFIDIGLLEEKELQPVYYATYKEIVDDQPEEGEEYYYYKINVRQLTLEEYQTAYDAFYKCYEEEKKDLATNPDKVLGEIISIANRVKKDAIGGWWVCPTIPNRIVVNKDWRFYSELTSLLDCYKYENYQQKYLGNYLEDEAAIKAKRAEWDEEKKWKKYFLKLQKRVEELERKKGLENDN